MKFQKGIQVAGLWVSMVPLCLLAAHYVYTQKSAVSCAMDAAVKWFSCAGGWNHLRFLGELIVSCQQSFLFLRCSLSLDLASINSGSRFSISGPAPLLPAAMPLVCLLMQLCALCLMQCLMLVHKSSLVPHRHLFEERDLLSRATWYVCS